MITLDLVVGQSLEMPFFENTVFYIRVYIAYKVNKSMAELQVD